MIKGFFRLIGRTLAYVWRWLDAVRRTVLNLVFLLIIAAIVALVMRPTLPLPDGAALVLKPAGALVEQRTLEDPFQLLRPNASPVAQTALRDLLEAVEAARDDPRIQVLVLDTDALNQAGLSKLAELRAAVEEFKSSGKPVLARGERFTQGQYYLASVADEVHLAPDGFLLLRGLSRFVTYFKGALDALGIRMHVFRVGEYKSFAEPFTRSDMSDEDRENSRDLLDGLWTVFREDIAASRGIAVEAFDDYVIGYRAALAAVEGDAAEAALRAGLVDRLSTRDQWRDRLREHVGLDDEGKEVKTIALGRYLAAVRGERAGAPDRIAVLVAQGSIVDGSGGPGSAGGDTLARLIREAREDDAVKALVLRIDSPGGSAWASEVIRRELEVTRAAGKPVVASMSSTAASGGYWIAAGADEIVAHPASLTGSIGIFALFPEIVEPLGKLGITVDGVATGPLAGAFDPRRPLDVAAAEALQLGIENGYRRFIRTVATAREMSEAEVELVARGRVWTGEAAHKLGLVDELGGLDAAIARAAARAGLERYELTWPAARLSPTQLLMQRLSDAIEPEAMPVGGLASLPLVRLLAAEAEALARWNDPRHVYMHCLCEGP